MQWQNGNIGIWNWMLEKLTELGFFAPHPTQDERFFPANLSAKYWKTKTNTTKANMHP